MENGAFATITVMVLCWKFSWITNSSDQRRVCAMQLRLHDTLGLEYSTGMV